MTNQNAARILAALAAQDPDYETLSAEYTQALSGTLSGVEVPADFAARTIDLLRSDPDTAAKIDRYERNLSAAQTFGLAEVNVTLMLVSALVLLLRPHVAFRTEWNLKFFKGALKFDTAAVDETTLNRVLSVLSAAAKKASEGLDGVAKALHGEETDSPQDAE